MDTTNCEREDLHRIEIPLRLLSDLARSLVHVVRGHLSVVSNDLEYFSTLLPNENDGSSATARSARRINETSEILELVSGLSSPYSKGNLDELFLRFFSLLGIRKEEIVQATNRQGDITFYHISEEFPELTQSTFSSVVDLAKNSVGEKGVVVAAVIDLLIAAQGLSFKASRTSTTAPFELKLSPSDGDKV